MVGQPLEWGHFQIVRFIFADRDALLLIFDAFKKSSNFGAQLSTTFLVLLFSFPAVHLQVLVSSFAELHTLAGPLFFIFLTPKFKSDA
ncbi:hypothetical protein CEXT_585341 [Caerostris extrusa]|uniref:Uncharacterized protein n=1 Tax=Caerostris extrusa TaxID=172846 RepID=A0AAV4Q953_CAEEX|nr:hypothetical protein CEXT_585341 [Caerostris extrusa]